MKVKGIVERIEKDLLGKPKRIIINLTPKVIVKRVKKVDPGTGISIEVDEPVYNPSWKNDHMPKLGARVRLHFRHGE